MVLPDWLLAASGRLDAWVEQEGFRGWDPYDALNSPLLKRLIFGSRRLGQAWVQLFKRSPLNFRPLVGIPKGYNPKAMGLFLASYWRKYLLTRQPAHLERALSFASWLEQNCSPGYSGAGWGYNFDWPNRGFYAPAGTPTIVNTAFIGLALLDLAGGQGGGRASWTPAGGYSDRALRLARSACDFIACDLNRLEPAPGELCFSYTPLDRRFVHNANLLGAWLLAEVAVRTGEGHLADLARAAARYSARCQRPDGAWLYGEDSLDSWVDNFHTGFVLVALKGLSAALGTQEFRQNIEPGYALWKRAFFKPDGAPRYYLGSAWPIDIHSIAQAILTYLAFSDADPQARELALQAGRWGVEAMQSPEGYFYYQRHRRYLIRIPYMRWSQAWMQRALVELEWTGKR